MEPRLTSAMRVSAYLRRVMATGRAAYVIRRGEEAAGAVLVRVIRGRAAQVYARHYGPDGALSWTGVLKEDAQTETAADAYCDRRSAQDPDIWILEIESSDGDPMLDADTP